MSGANALPASAVAAWLIESWETIDEMERTQKLASQKSKAAKALRDAIEQFWEGSDADLVAATKVSAAALSGFKNEGFTRTNRKMIPIARAIGVSLKDLCQGRVVRVQPESQSEGPSDLVSLAKEFVGTPKESLATDLLRLLRAKG